MLVWATGDRDEFETEDGVPLVFAVNVLAPYVLTALIERPDRLVYLSSGLHHSAEAHFDDLLWTKRPWHGSQAYSESKLYDAMLAFAVRQDLAEGVSQRTRAGLGRDLHGPSRGHRRS